MSIILSRCIMSYTKINLEEPFKSSWKFGYLSTNKDGRKSLKLYKSDNVRRSISYARYLMSVHLGYEIPSHLEVDHINDDKTDDRIGNFELKTHKENYKKYRKHYTDNIQQKYSQICNNCKNQFNILKYDYEQKIKRNTKNFYCCKECEIEYHEKNRKKLICPYCDTIFSIAKNVYNKKLKRNIKNIFCSDSCYKGFKKLGSKKILNCDTCGKEIHRSEIEYITEHKNKEQTKRFCSKNCFKVTVNMHTV